MENLRTAFRVKQKLPKESFFMGSLATETRAMVRQEITWPHLKFSSLPNSKSLMIPKIP